MDVQEQACWLLLTFKSGLSNRVVNEIIQLWCHQSGRTLQDFFAAGSRERNDVCHLNEKTTLRLEQAKEHTAEQIALIKELASDFIHILTLVDDYYPKLLKSTLQYNHLPPVLFYAGNLQLLERTTIAIIGSRNAGEISLTFTREVANYLSEYGANVISGYARGVDRAAYDGATSSSGCTTVVLPHGINTLSNVQMYGLLPKILDGSVLLLSQFHPGAIWLVSRAMARNKVVTGLAQVVIVAEANTQGGTWDAANGALEQGRPLYVCQAERAPLLIGNQALIERGGRPLYWSPEDSIYRIPTEDVLSPLLEESNMLHRKQDYTSILSRQLSRLLEEHGVYVS